MTINRIGPTTGPHRSAQCTGVSTFKSSRTVVPNYECGKDV